MPCSSPQRSAGDLGVVLHFQVERQRSAGREGSLGVALSAHIWYAKVGVQGLVAFRVNTWTVSTWQKRQLALTLLWTEAQALFR